MNNNNSYQKIKYFIKNKLQNVEGVLPKDQIDKEVENTKRLLEKFGPEEFANVLSTDSVSYLSDDDWTLMKRELETHFNVQMENGVLLQGYVQQQRDTTWWSDIAKQNNRYYWDRYKEHLNKSLPPEVIRVIDTDTDKILNNVGQPTIENFSIYGMVVGHVQSGKTGNYSAVVCKAADAGYKFIVIIAGSMNNLRNQTQMRLDEAFVGLNNGVPVGVGKLGDFRPDSVLSLTTSEQDFNKRDANKSKQGLSLDNINSPILMVIKKNSSTLDNVLDWLEKQHINRISNHAMLLIDDESDYASINTRSQEDPAIINKKIRKLLSLFNKSSYVAYTATPYANIFIDHEAENIDVGRDLFPSDFICALNAPDKYFGARKVFLDTDNKHIVEIDDYIDVFPKKKDLPVPSIPESLYEAIRAFVINVGIRKLRNQEFSHNSMLIHATRFTMIHEKISIHVEEYISKLKKEINVFGRLVDSFEHSNIIRNIKETYELRFSEQKYDFNSILDSICETINSIIIREVHTDTKIQLVYRKDNSTNVIVIGGSSLSRGYTLEGLSISYFLRTTVFYDTLMQMGRWFGYREGYEDLCRIYMPKSLCENFSLIIESTEDLIDTFKRMSDAKMTPNDFGLSVQHHPDSGLQVTARNKLKNSKEIYVEMKLDGQAKETSWLHKDEDKQKTNLEAIKDIIRSLSISNNTYSKVGNSHVWKDINKELVIEFLDKFQVYSPDPFGIKSRMPIDFIKKYVDEVNTLWDIALYSGEGEKYVLTENIQIYKAERKVDDRGDFYEIAKRQISSGSAESVALPESERKGLGSNRKDIREKMTKPLLMLHILDTEKDNKLAAFGTSFPGGTSSNNKTVKLKVNSVYIQELQKQLSEEEADD